MAECYLSQLGDFMLIDSSNSPLNGVIFHNVLNVYTNDEPIKCIYSITESIEPDKDDLIGLFKVGWVSSSEIYSSVPAKFPIINEKTFLHTLFDAHKLPRDSTDYFQFCYVCKNGDVVGASTPFMFDSNELIAVEDPADPGLLIFKSRVCQLKDELLKLTTDKNYYECKCEVANSNLLKLKTEFDKLELELNNEREAMKQLEESNFVLNNKLEELKIQSTNTNKKEDTFIDKKIVEVDSSKNIDSDDENAIASNPIIKSEIINTGVWESLFEIYEVVDEVKHSLKSNNMNQVCMSYQDLVDYILEVFSSTKKKFQIKSSGKTDVTKHCSCFFKQKAFCCPSLCSEEQFNFMMAQPIYTAFSNYNHYTEDRNTHCDGSYDPSSLSDYIRSLLPHDEFTNDSSKTDSKNVSNDLSLEDQINKIAEERDKANAELSEAKEKIATLNSRVNVLELELVAQQSVQARTFQNSTMNMSKKQSSLSHPDIESILESVNNEYIILKEKYSVISKKIAQCQSLESRCAFLENENKKLTLHFTLERDIKKSHEPSGNDTCSDLENMIRKQKTEKMLVNLQKESVGKISPNLLY